MKKTTIDLGTVAEKSATLRAIKLEQPTKKISTSCGCTAARAQNGQLLITFNAPEFPKHLKILGNTHMDSLKQVTVVYTTDEKEVFELRAKITPL